MGCRQTCLFPVKEHREPRSCQEGHFRVPQHPLGDKLLLDHPRDGDLLLARLLQCPQRAGLLPGRVVLGTVNLDDDPTQASKQHQEIHALAGQRTCLSPLRPGVRVVVQLHLRHKRRKLESVLLKQLDVLLEHHRLWTRLV